MLDTDDLEGALAELGMAPEFDVDGGDVRRIARIVSGERITFLSNPAARAVEITVRVPERTGPLVGWDPVTLARIALRPTGADVGIRSFAVRLPPFGSLFVLAGRDADPPVVHEERVELSGEWSLELPGRHPASMAPSPAPWSDLDDDARGFSGTGVYRLGFELEEGRAPHIGCFWSSVGSVTSLGFW